MERRAGYRVPKLTCGPVLESPCEHRWRHLRAWWIWDEPIGDLFYCERCLEYRRVRRVFEGKEENKTDVV